MSEDQKMEALAKAIWQYYYPNGGSIFKTFESLQEKDKECHRKEARRIARFLNGEAEVVLL